MNRIFCPFFLCLFFSFNVQAQFTSNDIGTSLKYKEVIDKVSRYYVDDTDPEKLTEKAIVAMLEELDPHSTYIPKEDLQAAQTTINGSFVGVGIRFQILKDTLNVVATISGGPAEKLGILPGDKIVVVDGINIAGIGENERVIVSTIWKAEEVDRVRVVVDYENFIVEVNDADNSAEHSIDVAYSKYFGWIDAPRENPLTWIFIILTLITVTVVISIASKTSLDFSDGALQEDYGWENGEDEEDLDDLEHEDY